MVFDYDVKDKVLDSEIESSPLSLILEKIGSLVSQTNGKTKMETDKKVKVTQRTSQSRNLWDLIDASEVLVEDDNQFLGASSPTKKLEMVDKDIAAPTPDAKNITEASKTNEAKITSGCCPRDSFVLVIHHSKQSNFMNLF